MKRAMMEVESDKVSIQLLVS